MTNKEAIENLERDCYQLNLECECEGVCCDECHIKMSIEALEKLEEITKGIEDLKETLRDAYKSNDYVLDKVVRNISLTECEDLMESFSVKVMQNLGWLLGVLDWSEDE